MLKLCHILSDVKFVDLALDYFVSSCFTNNVIIIGNEDSYKGRHIASVKFVDFSFDGIDTIISTCRANDVVIFYNLDDYNSYIANRLPSQIIKVWRFYGTEFYSLPENQLKYYSDKTKSKLGISLYEYKSLVYKTFRIFKYGLKFRITPSAEFIKAITKMDFFLAWDIEEYFIVKQRYKVFPQFVELSALSHIDKISDVNDKNKNIVIGNSRAAENNHLDILDIFEEFCQQKDYSLIFPLSYGEKGRYWSYLVNRIKSSKLNISMLDDYLPYDVYAEKTVYARAAIINTYRQMALGNTFLFLANAVKVYLSEKSTSFSYLKRLGFIVFSIESNLKKDIVNDELLLDQRSADNNRAVFDRYSNKQESIEFQKNFHELLSKASRANNADK